MRKNGCFSLSKTHTQKRKKKPMNNCWRYLIRKMVLPAEIDKRRCMRFLVTNQYKPKKAYQNIKNHLLWRDTMKPFILSVVHKKMLDVGYIYIHGRDKCLRPMCFSSMSVIEELGIEIEEVPRLNWLICFLLVDNFLRKGKVENWLFICDLAGLSFAKLPKSALKNIMTDYQEHLKCRMRLFFFFNVTFGLLAIWTMISPFLNKIIKHKIITKKADATDPALTSMAHPSQIEEKYCGEAPNVTKFWPPYCSSEEYGVLESSLSDEQFS
ncbi:unnamed protein product [Moneuplotes crassus]|uniref:CRAL-TRIO domain-containing protein n=1 Tax=Euplotes crassus TaxID=5936 RepID=A0AAD1XHB2_EUPCR|nr:unnamed protein product [Moneuplotes crassus]